MIRIKLLAVMVCLFFCSSATAQQTERKHYKGYYTQYCPDVNLVKTAKEWLSSGQWRNGFTKAAPHDMVNAVEFYEQYNKNPEQWKALFSWLQSTDLLKIDKGRHPISGSNLVASIEDDSNGPLETKRSESHYHHIDFQYVVKGVERFGFIDHYTSKPNCAYDSQGDVIHYDYAPALTHFYDSTPDKFFICFPSDWHIAKINNDTNDQNIRVIVIKVDYINK